MAGELSSLPFPPHTPLAGRETGSFAHATISARLPAILDTVLADLDRLEQQETFAQAGEQIEAARQEVRQLQEDMRTGAKMPFLTPPAAETRAQAKLMHGLVSWTNNCLAAWKEHSASRSWFELPWLVVECYMYTRLACIMWSQPALAAVSYDPFAIQKAMAFTKSIAGVVDVATSALPVIEAAEAAGPRGARAGLFQMFQYALWGNKTDLSLLVDAAQIGADGAARAKQVAATGSSQNLIADQYDAVWRCLEAAGPGGTVDLVLDNSGMELYTDLVLADYLLTSGLAASVRLHGKSLPWFVSDVMQQDLDALMAWVIVDTPPSGQQTPGWEAVQALGRRWQQHLQAGRWTYSQHEFWTSPFPFWWMQQVSPDLYQQLSTAKLVIFKGDLNYRKLAYDCRWPYTTPFTEALGPFRPAPLVTLRTLKADVIAGLAPGQGEALAQVDKDWLVNGRFGVIQYAARP